MTDLSQASSLTAFYHTFGCKLNFAETSTVRNMLLDRGITDAEAGVSPDIVIVNTCSVTELADKKCRQTIRSFAKRWPKASIVVTGCYAQLKSDEVASLPGVAIVAGNDRKLKLAEYIDNWLANHNPVHEITATKDLTEFCPSCSSGDRTRYFLKVQDGCDYFCSYCTIPYARGRSRSGKISQMVESARRVAEEGGREIVLTGVNIGDFGKGNPDGEDFFALIKALDTVEGIERFRISSIEPNLLTDEIIEWVAQSRSFMPHFHIPLQCGDDKVLELMRRHYDTSLFASKIERIRHAMPHAFIGVDLIVGARGETEERFANSLDFINGIDISRLHVFPYSERPGTLALRIDHVVDQATKHKRVHEMLEISDHKLSHFARLNINTVRPVLFEHTDRNGFFSGYTDNYIRVVVPTDLDLSNKIVNVRLTDKFEIKGGDLVVHAVID